MLPRARAAGRFQALPQRRGLHPVHVDDVNTVNEKEADDFVTRMGFGELLTLKR